MVNTIKKQLKKKAKKVRKQLDEFLLELKSKTLSKTVKKLKQRTAKVCRGDLLSWDSDGMSKKLAENVLSKAKQIRESLGKPAKKGAQASKKTISKKTTSQSGKTKEKEQKR